MYGPKWPFLLMYGSHGMRHTGIPRVDGLSTAPGKWGVTVNLLINCIFKFFLYLANS